MHANIRALPVNFLSSISPLEDKTPSFYTY